MEERMMEHQTENRAYTLDEIHGLLESGLQRELNPKENSIVSKWIASFDKEDRITVLNMFKELLNKHKRID
jgi:hypothetical protein